MTQPMSHPKPHAKGPLKSLGHKALSMARRHAHRGKIHFDKSALHLKKEHLIVLIGKEFVKLTNPCEPTPHLIKLLTEFQEAEKHEKHLKDRLASMG